MHGDDFSAVGTRTELLDDVFRINLIGMTGLACDDKSPTLLSTDVKVKKAAGAPLASGRTSCQ